MFKYLMILLCFMLFLFTIPGNVSASVPDTQQEVSAVCVDDVLLEFIPRADDSDFNFITHIIESGNSVGLSAVGVSVLKYPIVPG